ncbi:cobalt-precorrin-6A reductase [Rhodopseudomonas sp. HC1]|uniref:cobalt-precorrin-6A reductase n=1 Tax=Rhodopseudomonas infernalis TaxID=2897386 RepID=UPI001EE7DA0C|nr:cobalt-precorrin-6A reductase [Rhodopseudomonas infernalis]MCG6203356.1 cobalt-precorrin-6A reductase [Rhodopseudomonas infernalis]
MTPRSDPRLRLLILGGTADASRLAAAVAAEPRIDAVLSFAGRTETPKLPSIPARIGGFGGVAGLIDYLRAERIARVVDATHPFAAQMSRNAVEACAAVGVALLALERAPWQAQSGDRWIEVDNLPAAAVALGAEPRRVFLGIGRQNLDLFAVAQQHAYLVRLVDPPRGPLPLTQVDVVVARGPFDRASDRALLASHRIDIVVAKNAGGDAAVAKIEAARDLGLPVVMVRRPQILPRPTVASVADVMDWLAHDSSPTERGV